MNKEKLAKQLDGRLYGEELTKLECESAKEAWIVIVYWRSDDLVYLDGALSEEFYQGVNYIDSEWKITSRHYKDDVHIDDSWLEDLVYWMLDEYFFGLHTITPNFWYGWLKIESTIPHTKFNVYDDGDIYWQWIIFDLKDLVINK